MVSTLWVCFNHGRFSTPTLSTSFQLFLFVHSFRGFRLDFCCYDQSMDQSMNNPFINLNQPPQINWSLFTSSGKLIINLRIEILIFYISGKWFKFNNKMKLLPEWTIWILEFWNLEVGIKHISAVSWYNTRMIEPIFSYCNIIILVVSF